MQYCHLEGLFPANKHSHQAAAQNKIKIKNEKSAQHHWRSVHHDIFAMFLQLSLNDSVIQFTLHTRGGPKRKAS